jgi:polyphenol oxidase
MTLPSLDPAFRWTDESWGQALRCQPLAAIAQHAFTTRQLRLRGGPSAQPVAWTQATAALGGGRLDQLIRVRQVYGADVRVLKKGVIPRRAVEDLPEADAIISDDPNLILSVQVADCVPILIADPHSGAVAAVHAGWRGTCAGIAGAAVAAMVREFDARPSAMVAAIGPSIGPCCYTVGRNVLDAFRESGSTSDDLDRWFAMDASGRLILDLWTANRAQLLREGLNESRILSSRLCTQTHHDWFESYRVDGERAGRMAGLIAAPRLVDAE